MATMNKGKMRHPSDEAWHKSLDSEAYAAHIGPVKDQRGLGPAVVSPVLQAEVLQRHKTRQQGREVPVPSHRGRGMNAGSVQTPGPRAAWEQHPIRDGSLSSCLIASFLYDLNFGSRNSCQCWHFQPHGLPHNRDSGLLAVLVGGYDYQKRLEGEWCLWDRGSGPRLRRDTTDTF
ncbi:hypothetical protein BKA80DRAFT_250719 [Phyllosticta citrichinensis]